MAGEIGSIGQRQAAKTAAWTRFHEVSLGLVVGILFLLVVMLIASTGRGQERAVVQTSVTGARR